MIKQTEKDYKKWIRKQVDYYVPILGLQLHDILVRKNLGKEYMCITCTYPYLDPIIQYSQKSFEDWKRGEIKRDRILHELCHIMTDPLYVKATERYTRHDEINDEREKLTDTIACIIRKLT